MGAKIKVWDLPTRIFHWLLVALCITSVVTAQIDELQWHERSGLAILVLICWRLIWGIMGSDTARFVNFMAGPARIVDYIKSLTNTERAEIIGHNPVGALVVVVFLVLLFSQVATGLFANDEIVFDGPLARHVSRDFSDLLTSWHHRIIQLLIATIAIHVTANFAYLLVLKQNLIKPMLTGEKELKGNARLPALQAQNSLLAAVILAVVIFVIALTIGFR